MPDKLQPLDLVLWNNTPESYGAHVGIYVGDNQVLHLSRANSFPKVESLQAIATLPEYKVLLGGKRLKGGR